MEEKKRVAVLRSQLLPISETFIRDQVSALKSWTPILIGRENVEGGLATPGIQRVIVPESGGRLIRTLRFWMGRPDPALVGQLKQLNCTLAHVHFGIDATDFWPSIKAAGLPMVVTLHGADINIYRWWWELGHSGLRRRIYPRRLLAMARDPAVSFIAVSEAIKLRAIEYGIPQEKITVSYIGVDTDRFQPGNTPIEERAKRILFVGRMVEKKAPLLLIRAFADVKKQFPEAELVMIGTGPLLNEAKQLARDLQLQIEFLGAKNSSSVKSELDKVQLLCLPSVTAANGDAEGFGIVLLEAQSCGIPVISSALGGSEEGILDGVTGHKFPENSAQELTSLILKTLGNIEKLRFMSNASTTHMRKNFKISDKAKHLESIFQLNSIATFERNL